MMRFILMIFCMCIVSVEVRAENFDDLAVSTPTVAVTSVSQASGDNGTVTPEPVQEEPLPDLSTIKNPFKSKMPVREITKTSVDSNAGSSNISETNQKRSAPKVIPEQIVLPVFKISGIVRGAKSSQVIINNNVYSIGENFDGVQIRQIKKKGIDVTYRGRKFHVPLED